MLVKQRGSRYLDLLWTALISALAAIIASAGAIYLTKQKERDAEWRSKKLAYYEEFFGAASGIVGEVAPPEAKIRFATAVNNLHLIASGPVILALHGFTDEIAETNKANIHWSGTTNCGHASSGKFGMISTTRLPSRLKASVRGFGLPEFGPSRLARNTLEYATG